MSRRVIRIATRKSDLAMWQARHVASLLEKNHSELVVELVPLVTEGDRILDKPLSMIGGKGLFLKELERALLEQQADLAVHSMKDVPVEETPGLLCDVMLNRANAADAWLSHSGSGIDSLPAGSVVGTSSLRRQAQLLHRRPDLKVADLRGNVNTRLRKLDEHQYDAIILACAGLERLGMADRITEILSPPDWLPASAQGTIGLQYREQDDELLDIVRNLGDPDTQSVTRAERAAATALDGSCTLPLAIYAQLFDEEMQISGMVGEKDGKRILRGECRGPSSEPENLGRKLAADLLAQGAGNIIAATHASSESGP